MSQNFLTLIFIDIDFFENERIHIQTFRVFLLSTTSDGVKRSIPVKPKILQIYTSKDTELFRYPIIKPANAFQI
jgi:hypothetical protein